MPKKSSYVITSADSVLSELLTQRGVGTMFKKVAPVTRYTSLNDIVVLGERDSTGVTVQQVLPDLLHKYAHLLLITTVNYKL